MQTLNRIEAGISAVRDTIHPVPIAITDTHYKPNPAAKPFHDSTARFRSVCAGVRSGKTYSAAREFLRGIQRDLAVKKGRLRYWAVAPTYLLTRVQEEAIRDALPMDTVIKGAAVERQMVIGRVVIEFRSAEKPKHLVGVGLDGLWIDEVARVKADTWRGQLRMRLSDRNGWGLFSTTPLGRNWFFHEIWGKPDDNYQSFTWRTVDNVAIPALVAEVEQARTELPAAYFKREYEASFDAFFGQIYDEFDPAIHIIGPGNRCGVVACPEAWVETRYGFDPAFGHSAVLLAMVRDSSGVWYAVEECAAPLILSSEWAVIAREFQERWGEGVIYYDPSRPEYYEEFRDQGLRSEAGNNAVLAGIRAVATELHPVDGKPNIYIDAATCPTLAGQMTSYAWQEGLEKPVKKDDDAVDALRYALASEPAVTVAW